MHVKMAVTVPLAIILFVSGIYCPSTDEQEFPSEYRLESCKSNSMQLQLDSWRSAYKIVRNETNPIEYCLIQNSRGNESKYCFRKSSVEFTSMSDAQMTMLIYPPNDLNVVWEITGDFLSRTLAQQFHNDITRERRAEWIFLMRANYLKRSNNIVSNQLYLHLDGFDYHVTIVITNDEDDAVFIFPQDVISDITQSGPTEISANISIDRVNKVLYKFGFSNASQALAWSELLHIMSQPIRPESTETTYYRPHRNPAVEEFFREIEREIQLRREIHGQQGL